MQSTGQGDTKIIEFDTQHQISSVFFAEDGKEVFGRVDGSEGSLRRWRVSDGQQVGQGIQVTGQEIKPVALSPDGNWLVCALGPSKDTPQDQAWHIGVWDARTEKKVLDVEGSYNGGVTSIDISSDSTKFAAAGGAEYSRTASIRSIATGKKLVTSDLWSTDLVRFSPSGDRIATASTSRSQVYNSSGSYSSGYHYDSYGNYRSNSTPQYTYTYSLRIHDSENGQQLLNIPVTGTWTPFAWSADGRQLFVAYSHQVKCFDTSSGSPLNEWSVGGSAVALSRNERFIVVFTWESLSFWDTSAHQQIGNAIRYGKQVQVLSAALSPNSDNCVATSEHNAKIIVQDLRSTLPGTFFTLNVSESPTQIVDLTGQPQLTFFPRMLPLMYVKDTVYKPWANGDLGSAEELLTRELVYSWDPLYHASTLANRALVRTRSGQCRIAIDDAKESLKIQRTVVGHIANAMALVSNGEYDSGMRAYDIVFRNGFATDHDILLLIKAIILFQCGKHDDAVSRVDELIDIVDDRSLYITVRAYMYLLLGGMSLTDGDNERAIDFLTRARQAIPFQKNSYFVLFSLIFGWDFDKLAYTIQLHLQECIKPIEAEGDGAMQSGDPEEAIVQYSRALTLDPFNPAGLLVKRSKSHGMLSSWEDALKDADEAIKADAPNPWGYERRHAALHALQRYHDAVDTFTLMSSVIEGSPDEDTRRLGNNYVSPSWMETTIEGVVRGIFKICPPVLIDVESGCLCDGPERLNIFKSESDYKELVSSMTEGLDDDRIVQVVSKYFQYVMFSDVWEENEPSLQGVNSVTSVWKLDSLAPNEKLKKFCEVVRADGHRWAWSKTCCVDRTVTTVSNESLTMIYKWYEESASTLVLLASMPSPSALGDLSNNVWMTQAWNLQVALAPRAIRFYDRDWNPYLGDARTNHKESTEIMEELADALEVPQGTIAAFDPDDLSVREKLRLASTRNVVVEEDVAYSLIGLFKSDIRPHYGEGDAALGHLLEEIVARSGDVTVLSWAGKPSPYNSCLPASLTVYSQPPCTFPAVEDEEMDERVAALRELLSQTDVMVIYDRVTRLPPARFANRRLHLPSIIFAVKKLTLQDGGIGQKKSYRARVSGIGYVDIQTSDVLLTEPFKLVFVHPWLRDLRDPFDAFAWGSDTEDSECGSSLETKFTSAPSSPLHGPVAAPMDDFTRALRLVVRLRQPFHALLLQQQRNGQFKRVATEHEIVLPGVERSITFSRDVRTEVVEIL